MPTRRRATPPATKHVTAPVTTRHVLEDLSPSLRKLALNMAGGDWTRVNVLRRGAFEIVEPEATR